MPGRAGHLRGESRAGGWRALGIFWAVLAGFCAVLAGVLQGLGPVRPVQPRIAALPAPRPLVASPQAALLEANPADPSHPLPRMAADGRAARTVYAANLPAPPPGWARVGLILAGFGLDRVQSEAALHNLPRAVTLAVSPYAASPDPLLAAARAGGHEYLLSVPMEPNDSALDDEGDHALLSSASGPENTARLDWALSRVQGYVGATDLLVGHLVGDRFLSDGEASAPVLNALARRGLGYAGAIPSGVAPPGLWARPIELLVDRNEDAGAVDARLADLVALARRDGSALGAAGTIRPITVARIAAWAKTLAGQKVALVPVSQLLNAPAAR